MGLFSSKTKVYVSSSVYNLAGDITKRPNYLKTTVMGNIIAKNNFSMADTITSSYLNGPGIRLRQFANWSKDNFDPVVGVTSGSLVVLTTVNPDTVASQITPPAGEVVVVQHCELGFGDYEYWADRWIYANRPEKMDATREVDYLEGQVIITYEQDGAVDRFTPEGFDPNKMYLYASYVTLKTNQVKPPVIGDVTVVDTLPSTSGWTVVNRNHTPQTTELTTLVHTKITYTDGRPHEESETSSEDTQVWDIFNDEYTKTESLGDTVVPNFSTSRKSTMYQNQTGSKKQRVTTTTDEVDIGDGVIKKTVVTTTADYIAYVRTYQINTVDTLNAITGFPKILIYQQHSGNAVLDKLFKTYDTDSRFYPFIPIRHDNGWVGGNTHKACKKAFKKATGGSLDQVVEELGKNKNIGDIQFIYGTFGCSLNTPEHTAKEYIYRFFQMANKAFPPDPNYPTLAAMYKGFEDASKAAIKFDRWVDKGGYGPRPPMPSYPQIPNRVYRISSSKGYLFDITISWSIIDEVIKSGQAWAGAKQGELKIKYEGSTKFPVVRYITDSDGEIHRYERTVDLPQIGIYWQDSKHGYRKITVHSLHHSNRVYDGKSVEITGRDALGDSEESGFIIPLHTAIYKSMPITSATQMSTACTYLLLNCYKKVKKKWYQTGIFQIVTIVVTVAITVFSGGIGAGSMGILGASASIGASLGFAGLAAIIVGTVANAVAAMILMSIIQTVSVAVFGDKLGFIIAAIANIVAMNVGMSMSTGNSLSSIMGDMMKADNLLMLTNSVGNGISKYINASGLEALKQAESVMQEYKDQSKEIMNKYEEMFGLSGMGIIDPMQLTDYSDPHESRDAFLSRTLLTGSDIADMSTSMISNFADITLTLDM